MDDKVIEAITKVANTLLHKEHPDLSITFYQAKVVMEAAKLLSDSYEKMKKEVTLKT